MELHSLGIRVVLVEPGSYDTDIWTHNVNHCQRCARSQSPDKEQGQRFAQFVKGRCKRHPHPRAAAQLILRIANNPNPRLRYMIGGDAKLRLLAQRFLPSRRYERMITKAVKIDY